MNNENRRLFWLAGISITRLDSEGYSCKGSSIFDSTSGSDDRLSWTENSLGYEDGEEEEELSNFAYYDTDNASSEESVHSEQYNIDNGVNLQANHSSLPSDHPVHCANTYEHNVEVPSSSLEENRESDEEKEDVAGSQLDDEKPEVDENKNSEPEKVIDSVDSTE